MTNISPGTEHDGNQCTHCLKPVVICQDHRVNPCHIHQFTRLHICSWTAVPTTVATPARAAA